MAQIRLGDDSDLADAANVDLELVPGAVGLTAAENAAEQKSLARSSLIAKSMTAVLTLCLLILWPMPMYGSGYVFSKKFFTGWVVVGILWLFCSAGAVGVYPLWEGRASMAHTFRGIVRDLQGKGRPARRVSMLEGMGEREREGSVGVVVGEEKGVVGTVVEKSEE